MEQIQFKGMKADLVLLIYPSLAATESNLLPCNDSLCIFCKYDGLHRKVVERNCLNMVVLADSPRSPVFFSLPKNRFQSFLNRITIRSVVSFQKFYY